MGSAPPLPCTQFWQVFHSEKSVKIILGRRAPLVREALFCTQFGQGKPLPKRTLLNPPAPPLPSPQGSAYYAMATFFAEMLSIFSKSDFDYGNGYFDNDNGPILLLDGSVMGIMVGIW